MYKILLSVSFLFTLRAHSQDTVKIRQIDSLVQLINQPGLKVQSDSIFQDHPELGLSMKTYLTMIIDGNELKKYVNNVYTTRVEKGVTNQMFTSNIFYYNKNKLIKVDESANSGDKKYKAEWYYADDKPLYYTDQSPKSEDRANFLLSLSKTILKQMLK